MRYIIVRRCHFWLVLTERVCAYIVKEILFLMWFVMILYWYVHQTIPLLSVFFFLIQYIAKFCSQCPLSNVKKKFGAPMTNFWHIWNSVYIWNVLSNNVNVIYWYFLAFIIWYGRKYCSFLNEAMNYCESSDVKFYELIEHSQDSCSNSSLHYNNKLLRTYYILTPSKHIIISFATFK